ncbi:MAG: TM2 domain-containing protein [Candidatus Anstonellaceae archaeon]
MKKEVLEHLEELYTEKQLLQAYELTKKNLYLALLLGFLFSPLAYAYIKRWEYVVLSTFTLNYLFLGFFLAPIHIYYLFSKAKEELG